MTRKDIRIVRMQSATIIDSPSNFISYDHRAGEFNEPIQCVKTFSYPVDFIKDLIASKIVNITIIHGDEKDKYASFCIVLKPLFGYTNQKLEDIFCELFEKYNL